MLVIPTLFLLSYQLATTASPCQDGSVLDDDCLQQCGMDKCWCNTSHADNLTYDSCNQTCIPPKCTGGNMMCKAADKCKQICFPGECIMNCDAKQSCIQNAENGLKKMRCSSKQCTQTCKGGCKAMDCESENCHQSCGKGGCTMNCTQSVKFCFQSCTANDDCILDCHARTCQQQCSGPKKCIILNSGVCGVYVYFLAFLPVLAGFVLQYGLS